MDHLAAESAHPCSFLYEHRTGLPPSLVLGNETRRCDVPTTVVVDVIRDECGSLDHPLGDAIEMLIRSEYAGRFFDEVCRDDPDSCAGGTSVPQ